MLIVQSVGTQDKTGEGRCSHAPSLGPYTLSHRTCFFPFTVSPLLCLDVRKMGYVLFRLFPSFQVHPFCAFSCPPQQGVPSSLGQLSSSPGQLSSSPLPLFLIFFPVLCFYNCFFLATNSLESSFHPPPFQSIISSSPPVTPNSPSTRLSMRFHIRSATRASSLAPIK